MQGNIVYYCTYGQILRVMVSMYTITQYISNICLGIQQRSRVRPEKLIVVIFFYKSGYSSYYLGQVFWDISLLCTGNHLGMVFSNETVVCLFWWLQRSFKVTLIHSSISAIVHNNVHKALYPNLLFLSCVNHLLMVRDPSGVGDWSVCVKNMFMLHDVSVCMGKLETIFTVPCSPFYY